MLYDPKWEVKVEPRAATILREARALIEKEENWCSYAARDGHKRCALIAIGDCGGMPEEWRYLYRAISGGDKAVDIGSWNDTPGRTHAEVLAAFDRAIELARKTRASAFFWGGRLKW